MRNTWISIAAVSLFTAVLLFATKKPDEESDASAITAEPEAAPEPLSGGVQAAEVEAGEDAGTPPDTGPTA